MSLSTPASAWPDRVSRSLRTLSASGGARVGTAILVVVLMCAMAPRLLAPSDPTEQRILARFTPPLSRAADGTFAVLLPVITGTVLGLLAGVRGGASDHAIMRLADMQLAFPFILLAITVIGIL